MVAILLDEVDEELPPCPNFRDGWDWEDESLAWCGGDDSLVTHWMYNRFLSTGPSYMSLGLPTYWGYVGRAKPRGRWTEVPTSQFELPNGHVVKIPPFNRLGRGWNDHWMHRRQHRVFFAL